MFDGVNETVWHRKCTENKTQKHTHTGRHTQKQQQQKTDSNLNKIKTATTSKEYKKKNRKEIKFSLTFIQIKSIFVIQEEKSLLVLNFKE